MHQEFWNIQTGSIQIQKLHRNVRKIKTLEVLLLYFITYLQENNWIWILFRFVDILKNKNGNLYEPWLSFCFQVCNKSRLTKISRKTLGWGAGVRRLGCLSQSAEATRKELSCRIAPTPILKEKNSPRCTARGAWGFWERNACGFWGLGFRVKDLLE